MSETAQKETEIVQGVIKGVIVKGTDKWQIEVQPEGSQYTKKLWTKDRELVDSMPAKIGQAGAFVCNISPWVNSEGKTVRSLWVADTGMPEPEHPAPETWAEKPASSVATPQPRVYTPDLKDRMIVRQTCLKAASELVSGWMPPSDDYPLDVMKAAQRFETWVYRDIEDVPFEGGGFADDKIPF